MSIMRCRSVGTGWVGANGLATYYFLGAGSTPTAGEALEAANRVRAFQFASRSLWPTAENWLVNPQIDFIDPTTGALTGGASVAQPAVVAGTGAGSFNDFHSMALLQLLTNTIINARRVRGRSNIGPLDTGTVSSGVLNSTSQTTLTTAAASLSATISVPISNVVWHRPTTPASGGYALVTAYATTSKLAVLRSRRD